MQLPVRILPSTSPSPVVSVDGAWEAPGLNLSHWPGHRTPRELAHELSTGAALNFARLPRERREELARGCTAIANNHFDTDGTCALFAVRHPELALRHEKALLEAAAAGDFFELPSEDALRVDLIVSATGDPERSVLGPELAKLDNTERHQRATDFLLEQLPQILAGDFEPYRAAWHGELEQTRADCAELQRAARDDVAHLDWTTWVARFAHDPFRPGRHALFGTSGADRVLVASPCRGGVAYRFLIGTRSWFDLPGRERRPRPELHRLAGRLNTLEGVRPSDARAWRCQPPDSPSPELWFGARENEFFSERGAELAPSSLEIAHVRRAVAEVLRESLALPE
jgi:hypothetical protein